MKEIIMTKGLPGSGKSTWAREYIKTNRSYKIICKDDLREMLDAGRHTKANEKFVVKLRDELVNTALFAGYSAIVADTNLNSAHETRLREIAGQHQAGFRIQDFTHVPIETCIEQDLKRLKSVGERVIRRMARELVPVKDPRHNEMQRWKAQMELPRAIICDIDNTLALMCDRSPYDWKRVGEDSINIGVLRMLRRYTNPGVKVIFLSGRDSVCRPETEAWLARFGLSGYPLFMRPEGDQRKDVIIKQEIYEREIKEKYFVEAVIDDRLSVCRMWHHLGLPLFRVGNPDDDF